jgi:Holliday junction resolvase RusA-like endonuclease
VIEFVVNLPPRPKLRARHVIRYRGTGRNRTAYTAVITPDQTIADEQAFRAIAKSRGPRKPLEGPLALRLLFVMPVPASWSIIETARAVSGARRPAGKPDVDNMVKLVKDALNGVFWKDDAQVCEVTASKVYGMLPRTEVQIHEIAGSEDPSLFDTPAARVEAS